MYDTYIAAEKNCHYGNAKDKKLSCDIPVGPGTLRVFHANAIIMIVSFVQIDLC